VARASRNPFRPWLTGWMAAQLGPQADMDMTRCMPSFSTYHTDYRQVVVLDVAEKAERRKTQ